MRWIFLVIIMVGLSLPSGVFAMNLSPSATDMVLMPGEQGSLEFIVENTSTIFHTYTVSVYDVAFPTDTGELQFGPLSKEHSAWLAFDTYEFSLAPAVSRMITLTATIPEDADVDTLVFAPVVRESSAGGGITLATGVSSLVFLTVGNPLTEASIDSFTVSPWISAHLPLTFSVYVANSGERIVQPYGIVRIRDLFGREIDSLDFNEEFRRVPALLSREFRVQWGESAEQGDGVFQELWRELTAGMGLFTAELVAAPYPGAEPTLYATTRVVVFPWRIAMIVCGLGLLASFVIARKRRRF